MSSDRRDDRSRDRDRDRGSRDRLGRPNETNRNDSKSIRCRVFVGNLNSESLSRQEFEEVFAKHGRIIGCSIHNGYGFVQYEKESGADEAVAKEHGSIIKGRRVDVNLAGDRRRPDKRLGPPSRGRGRGHPGSFDRPRDRSLSPPDRRRPEDPYGPPDYKDGRDRFRDAPQDPLDRGPPLKRSPYGSSKDPYGSAPEDLPSKRPRPEPDYLPPPKPAEAPIDCEIIIINKQQRGYADLVEKKVRTHGLVVECAHLPETVTLADELEDAIRRGVLYGIIISSQHEVHHSVTVHILHGTQQEHRNMPLEDAINLVTRNFELYMQALRERERDRDKPLPLTVDSSLEAARGYGAGNPPPPVVAPSLYSPGIAPLLNMAADGKSLNADQYSLLVDEFTKLRDERLKQEGRALPASSGTGSKPFPNDPQSIALQQAELQAKILSILNPGNSLSKSGSNSTTASSNTNGVQANSAPVSEAKPTIKIPVLTPSCSASTPFKAPPSTLSSQASSGANKVFGMAYSTMRGAVAQSGASNQRQVSGSYAPSSYSVASMGSVASSVKAWPQTQYRVPVASSGSPAARTVPGTVQGYGVRAPYTSPGSAGYPRPNSYPGRY